MFENVSWKEASLSTLIDQLEFCNFKDGIGHQLKMNVAFIELKRRASEELKSYSAPSEDDGGVHVYEIAVQDGEFRAVLYESIGGRSTGCEIIDCAIGSIGDLEFEKRAGSWKKYLTPEQIASNNRHGKYNVEDNDDACPYTSCPLAGDNCPGDCGELSEVILFNSTGGELRMDVDDAADYVIGIRIVSFTPDPSEKDND